MKGSIPYTPVVGARISATSTNSQEALTAGYYVITNIGSDVAYYATDGNDATTSDMPILPYSQVGRIYINNLAIDVICAATESTTIIVNEITGAFIPGS